MFMLRIRFDTFCTVPVIASSAPMRRANWISQPSQACRLLACASLAIGVISMSEKRPEALSSCRNRSLRRASRSCSSGRAPLIAPSRLVSINSKSKTATDCATVGPQLTNNKAHNVTRYDGMIMVVYLGQVLALACSFVAPRTYAVAAFVRPWLRTAQSGRHLAIFDALLVARLAAQPLFGGSRRLGLDLVRLAVRARSQRHLRYEYHRHQSNRSWHRRRRQHRRLHPAAVGSLLQILIVRIRKENVTLVTVHGKPCRCRSGGSGALIPSPGRSA